MFRNPDLALVLERLAHDNSVAAFYQGDVARQIAKAFAAGGGLVTAADLAAYQAREVPPLTMTWRGATICTAPLTAGGLSVLQVLAALKALDWSNSDAADPRTLQARIEAMRLAWHDRLALLGDPNGSDVPVARLLSEDYAAVSAERIRRAVDAEQMLAPATDGRTTGGTIHLSSADRQGMMAAITLTHGESFGAQVTVEGLGLVLGHGMSRFEPASGRANSVRPGCRPLNNMCPTVILRDGRPVVAMGATGGRRIPNTLVDVLAELVGRDQPLARAFATPRLHTEGDATLAFGKGFSDVEIERLKRVGYTIKSGGGASLNAIARDPASGRLDHVPPEQRT